MNALAAGTVLLVEPDDGTRKVLAASLGGAGYEVVEARDGMEAFAAVAQNETIDLAVTEMVLPVISGLEVVAHLLERKVAVVVTSKLDAVENRVRALELGCDDYVVKPYAAREVVVRVGTVLRRANRGTSGTVLSFNGLRIDPECREVWVRDDLVDTTAKEFDLLAYLASSPGTVFTRERLLQSVWNSSSAWQQPGTVTEHIRRLREKIEDDPARPKWLVTVRGVGYKFERRHQRPESGASSTRRQADRRERLAEHRVEVA